METKSNSGVTRRGFARQSAVIGAGAIAVAAGARAAHHEKTVEGTIKVGIIGCGGRMTGDISRLLGGNDDVKLIAMADLFEDKLQKLKARLEGSKDFGDKVGVEDANCFTGWDGYKKLLDTDVDLVLDACTPYVRPKHAEAAVDAGKQMIVWGGQDKSKRFSDGAMFTP